MRPESVLWSPDGTKILAISTGMELLDDPDSEAPGAFWMVWDAATGENIKAGSGQILPKILPRAEF